MSSINPNNINGQYPIAGQDNDSQGFRDNFTNIKNNLTFAKSEIEDIQQNAILKTPLSGTTLNNEMNNSQLKGVQCLRFTETIKDLSTITDTSFAINWEDGHYQYGTLGASTTLTFQNWATSGFYNRLRLELYVDSAAISGGYTVTFSTSGVTYIGLSDIQGVSTNVFTPPAVGYYVFELSTRDFGLNVIVEDVLRNSKSLVGTNVTASTNLTVGGNVIASGYQYSNTATTGGSLAVNINVHRVVLDPVAGFDKYDLNLPAGNVDAKTIKVSSTETISNLRVNGNNGTTVKPSANVTLTAGTSVEYFFHAAESKWYKVS